MGQIPATITCPSCKGRLAPRVLACQACDLEVKAHFTSSEFAALDDRLLHFLRIFVHCEGRIKDMEKALGVSYPTVKAMTTELKKALGLAAEAAPEPDAEPAQATSTDILDAMQRGEIPYEEALNRIKKGRKK